MDENEPSKANGTYLSPPKINKQGPNIYNWYHKVMDQMQNKNTQPSTP